MERALHIPTVSRIRLCTCGTVPCVCVQCTRPGDARLDADMRLRAWYLNTLGLPANVHANAGYTVLSLGTLPMQSEDGRESVPIVLQLPHMHVPQSPGWYALSPAREQASTMASHSLQRLAQAEPDAEKELRPRAPICLYMETTNVCAWRQHLRAQGVLFQDTICHVLSEVSSSVSTDVSADSPERAHSIRACVVLELHDPLGISVYVCEAV
jgi:hypothetical protein